MLKKSVLLVAAALLAAGTSANAAQWIVDLDGQANASMDGSTAKMLNLAAGRYRVTFTEGEYTAFSRWNATSGCNSVGEQCRQGWENSAVIGIGAIDIATANFIGDAGGTGGYGPQGSAYFATPGQSLAHAAQYVFDFTLTGNTNVYFGLGDDRIRDNRGGVSLLVESVPEPATWAMLIAGFGMIGFAARRRRTVATA